MGLFGNNSKTKAKELYDKALPLYEQRKYTEALKPMKQAAESGLAEAQYVYADILYHDGADKTDPDRRSLSTKDRRQKNIVDALEWALKSAKQGNMDAQLLCGRILASEMNDRENAVKWYKAATEHDDPWAYHLYGACLSDYKQYEEASRLFLKSWDMGDTTWSPTSCIKAYKNIGTKAGRTKALELCNRRISELSKAEENNSKKSEFIRNIAIILFLIAQIYYEDGDKENALHWFLRSYNLNDDKDTAHLCAKMYYEGDGIDQDYLKAYNLYSALAENKFYDRDAIYRCGIMQFFGEGIPVSYEQAFQYFTRLLNRGDDMGRYLCIVMYHNGTGVPADNGKALELLEGFPHEVFYSMQEMWVQECIKREYYTWESLKIIRRTVNL